MSDHLRTVAAEVEAAHRFHLRGTAIMTFVIYWLVVLSYQDYFFFDPTTAETVFRKVSLWICLVGWILAAVGTPVALLTAVHGSRIARHVVPVTVLTWPVGVVLAQVSAYAETGISYLGYLLDSPIFVLTDVALPAFLLLKWSRLREAVVRAEIDGA